MNRYFRTRTWFFAVLLVLAPAICLSAQTAQTAQTGQSHPKSEQKSNYFNASQLLRDVEYLSSDELEGRSAERPSMQKARDYVEKRFTELGLARLSDSFRQEFTIKSRRSAETANGLNFLGYLKGAIAPEKYIVVTAHYDHVGVINGEIHNGADDNASGTSALFALAEHFTKHRPSHSVIFVAFDAEERGLQGAAYFVSNLPIPKASILLNVNMDMLSRSDKGELHAAGLFHYPQFRLALETAQKKARVKLLLGHDDPKLGRDDWTTQSDHASFHREKIPFIYFGVEDHKDYHKPTDDFANIHPDFYIKAVETVIETVKLLDKTKIK